MCLLLKIVVNRMHDDCWVRIINEVDLGTPVQEVLEIVGSWWSEYTVKKEEVCLAALAIERGGPADDDNSETVGVCIRHLQSQQCVPASPVKKDINMKKQVSNTSSQAVGADGGMNNDASDMDHQMDEDDNQDYSIVSAKTAVADGDGKVMVDGENNVHSETAHQSAEPDAGHAASTGQCNMPLLGTH
ncbi:hypothetical protein P692DRAFT_20817579 [Suillus brevipes Sb2]|nr:hypothetical protein P692DRAFT_20817579 [Suillus brevipes Sb2]